MTTSLKPFQESVCDGITQRFANVQDLYARLSQALPKQLHQARCRDAAVVLQAPTGSGKTLVAVEAMRRHAAAHCTLWFWFAPFVGLVEQSRRVIAAQAPELRLFDLDADRQLDAVREGGVFVVTWASLAARSVESRKARQRSDAGSSIDDLIALARQEGLTIGCVVDEAHHGFQRAAQARAFFSEVLQPDLALLMTATPRDADMGAFEKATRYEVGDPADWASVSRYDAVQAGLLKEGVRIVRFLARDDDTEQLVDFEHLALRECAATHRKIAESLNALGAALTPLMLVQVPDGKQAQEDARRFLVDELKFDEAAVRIHTADEPDPDLLSLADDPTVEVLIFKMAVALGFDAPRAFTLAALRGTRDANFGVQIIGRIVRRHRLLQHRDDLPGMLQQGYVFLANSASQEGLLEAGAQINALTTHAPELGTQTVVSIVGDTAQVQLVRSGEPLSLLVASGRASIVDTSAADAVETSVSFTDGHPDLSHTPFASFDGAVQGALLAETDEDASISSAVRNISSPFVLARESLYRYPRRDGVPATLRGETLPVPPADFEAHLAAYVDFSPSVLADRFRHRVQVKRSETDLFDDRHLSESADDIWASLSPMAVAHRAEQLRLRLSEANDRELYQRLLDRFRAAIEGSGAECPEDEEVLMQQLDLVVVRRPSLLRDACRRIRLDQVLDVDVPIAAELQSGQRLLPAARNAYGVFPPDMNEDEMAVARLLDGSPMVRWWHRNLPFKGVGLYRWDEGAGFYPDFILGIEGRGNTGTALLEVKGHHLWGKDSEVEKSHAKHRDYGAVFTVGRRRGERDFHFLRDLNGKLDTEGSFSLERLRFIS